METCKKVALICFLLISTYSLSAQADTAENFPTVGKRCPDFILNDIGYFPQKRASLGDFRNKWLILDFFSTGCELCFTRMPKVNQIQKEFDGKVQIILIGKDDRFIRKYYENFRKHYGLTLPVVYDTSLFRQFEISRVPYAVWIDGNGIVQAITLNIERNDVKDFIGRKPVNTLLMLNSKQELALDNYYDDKKPLLIGHNGGSDTNFLFRSLLAKWDPKSSFYFDDYISRENGQMVQMTGIALYFFYRLAFGDTVAFIHPRMMGQSEVVPNHYGQWKYYPVLEMKDTSLFRFNETTGENLFSYSLIVPKEKANPQFLQRTMQHDLYNYFGFRVQIEKRVEPYIRIRVVPHLVSSLMTKGGKAAFKADFIHVSMQNRPIRDLISDLYGFYQRDIFIDETGIKGNIDIEFDAVMTDLDDIKNALKAKGLILEKGFKEMNVIVVRDSVNSNKG